MSLCVRREKYCHICIHRQNNLTLLRPVVLIGRSSSEAARHHSLSLPVFSSLSVLSVSRSLYLHPPPKPFLRARSRFSALGHDSKVQSAQDSRVPPALLNPNKHPLWVRSSFQKIVCHYCRSCWKSHIRSFAVLIQQENIESVMVLQHWENNQHAVYTL